MADFWNEDDDTSTDNQGDGSGPKALRDALKKAQAELDRLKGENAKLSNRVRTADVADLLQAKGASPRLAKYALPDLDDVTEESVSKWLAENKDVFNIKTTDSATTTENTSDDASQSTDADDAPDDEPGSEPDPEELAALVAALSMGQGGVIPSSGAASLINKVESAGPKSYEDVIALLNGSGVETTSGY